MGFGLLFLGYFVSYAMTLILPVGIVGYVMMFLATRKLSEYNSRFQLCGLPLAGLTAVSVYELGYTVCDHLSLSPEIFSAEVSKIVFGVREGIAVAFHTCLLIAICSIAKSTELDKLAFKSMRNLVVVFVGEIAYFVALLMPSGEAASVVGYVGTLLRLAFVVLNLLLIANCYRLICAEGDEEMSAKESRFEIINKMNAVINKREEEAMQAATELSQKRAQKKKEKNQKRRK